MNWKPGEFITSHEQAEHAAAAHMRALGFRDAYRTPTGPDGGVDVRSSAAIAQVKRVAAQTGRPDLQRLVGARGRNHDLLLIFYAAAGYSRSAIEYAETMSIALFTYSVHGEVTAVTSAAQALLRIAAEERRREEARRRAVERAEEERSRAAERERRKAEGAKEQKRRAAERAKQKAQAEKATRRAEKRMRRAEAVAAWKERRAAGLPQRKADAARRAMRLRSGAALALAIVLVALGALSLLGVLVMTIPAGNTTAGERVVGVMIYLVLAAFFSVPGVAILRRRRRKKPTDKAPPSSAPGTPDNAGV